MLSPGETTAKVKKILFPSYTAALFRNPEDTGPGEMQVYILQRGTAPPVGQNPTDALIYRMSLKMSLASNAESGTGRKSTGISMSWNLGVKTGIGGGISSYKLGYKAVASVPNSRELKPQSISHSDSLPFLDLTEGPMPIANNHRSKNPSWASQRSPVIAVERRERRTQRTYSPYTSPGASQVPEGTPRHRRTLQCVEQEGRIWMITIHGIPFALADQFFCKHWTKCSYGNNHSIGPQRDCYFQGALKHRLHDGSETPQHSHCVRVKRVHLAQEAKINIYTQRSLKISVKKVGGHPAAVPL